MTPTKTQLAEARKAGFRYGLMMCECMPEKETDFDNLVQVMEATIKFVDLRDKSIKTSRGNK